MLYISHTFYIMLLYLKSFFCFQDIQIFVLVFWSCRKNGLIRKIRLILKFMTSQPGKQLIAMHILPSISRSKEDQTMSCGQLIEYNMINTFLESSYTKFGGESIPRSFSKTLKLSISLEQLSKNLYSLVLSYAKLKAIEILELSFRPLVYTSYKAFSKTKTGLELVSLPRFLHNY